jgi:hypothetical protein
MFADSVRATTSISDVRIDGVDKRDFPGSASAEMG